MKAENTTTRRTKTAAEIVTKAIAEGEIPDPAQVLSEEQPQTEEQPKKKTMLEMLKDPVDETMTREQFISNLIGLLKPRIADANAWYAKIKARQMFAHLPETENPIEEAVHAATDLALVPMADPAEQRAPKDLIKMTFGLSDRDADPRNIERLAERGRGLTIPQVAAYRSVPVIWKLRKDRKTENNIGSMEHALAELF